LKNSQRQSDGAIFVESDKKVVYTSRLNNPCNEVIMPATTTMPEPTTKDKVQGVINLIRPAVQADGGDIELVDVTTAGQVHIRFHGACCGCPSSTMTLQMGIERNLRERVPEITGVIPVQ
jgi:Fe-S cluster biogenesis protein NfuA